MDLKYLTEYNKKVIEKYHKEINKLKLFNCGMSIKDRDKAIILFVLKNIIIPTPNGIRWENFTVNIKHYNSNNWHRYYK